MGDNGVRKVKIIFTALVCVTVALVAFWLWPSWAEYSSVSRELARLEKELPLSKATQEQYDRVINELDVTESALREVEAPLLSYSDLPAQIRRLEGEAGRSEVTLLSIRSGEPEATKYEGLALVNINLTVKGEYESIVEFVTALRNSETFPFLKIAALKTNVQQDGEYLMELSLSQVLLQQ